MRLSPELSTKRIKLLHLINDMSINGGAQRFVMDLVSRTPGNYMIRVVTLDSINDYSQQITDLGHECYCWSELTLSEKLSMMRWPEIVHGHLFPSVYLATLFRGNKLQTEHATHNRRRDFPKLKLIEWLMYRRYERVVSISKQVEEALLTFLPGCRDKSVVIENGVDLEQFDAAAQSRIKSLSNVRIGMVGRFHPYKDQLAIIKALALLGEGYEVLFVGDGELRQMLVTAARDLGVEEQIRFIGVSDDIPGFLAGLDIYVQSSKVEGFGLAAVEAMAAGLPVLASDIPGLREVVGSSEYLFSVGDERELADKISHFNNAESYTRAKEYAGQRAQLFGIQTFIERYAAVYAELAAQG
ncbi:glycosyltransferase [Amphritea sp. HPY]|uniref:glycosyltransferase n=1 Tax=Amphritea sp. HPY TaxID=3421652 RepID=UPI003D7C3953